MKVGCIFHANMARLALIAKRSIAESNVQVCPIRGSLLLSSSEIKCVGDVVEILLFPADGTPVLLTNNSKYKGNGSSVIDYSFDEANTLFQQVITLCVEKYRTSANEFHMEFSVDKTVVDVTMENNVLAFYMRAVDGDAVLTATKQESVEQLSARILRGCSAVKSFRYTSVTDSCDRSVLVRRGQVEIFREIAHYINRALVFVKRTEQGVSRQYCITTQGCCERIVTKQGVRIARLPITKVNFDSTCYVYAVDLPFSKLLKCESFTDILTGRVS